MGIPFYGYDFSKPDQGNSGSKKSKGSAQPVSANPIMGEAFLAVLRKVKPKLKWEEQHAEHIIKYKVSAAMVSVMTPMQCTPSQRLNLTCSQSGLLPGVSGLAITARCHRIIQATCQQGVMPAPGCKSLMTHPVVLCCAVQDGGLRHTVYYPTPAALAARIKLASELGVGLSIWELGQGVDSFLDLL